ncbi:MAG: hypothetical protein SFW35_06160 [Chitinophagales bacterium]|nr:hypothetical protein [Chitinophagales bacterium]
MDFEEDEADEVPFDPMEAHKFFAINLYNQVWDLIEKPNRTEEDNTLMLDAAYASAYHWLQVGTPVNFQRSEWQLARVNIVLGNKEAAMQHAQKCFALTQEHRLIDFDLAFAYETMARAFALNGKSTEYEQYKALAVKASEQIEDADDREVFIKDLNSGPWFGFN